MSFTGLIIICLFSIATNALLLLLHPFDPIYLFFRICYIVAHIRTCVMGEQVIFILHLCELWIRDGPSRSSPSFAQTVILFESFFMYCAFLCALFQFSFLFLIFSLWLRRTSLYSELDIDFIPVYFSFALLFFSF